MDHLGLDDSSRIETAQGLLEAQSLLKTMQALNSVSSLRLEESATALEDTSFTDVAAAIKQALGSPKYVAIFIRDKELPPKRLALKGNFGYKSTIGEVTYDLKQPSLTKQVFEDLAVKNLSSKELSGPSKLRCASFMPDGVFVNVLAIPICTSSKKGEAECFGVLKIENDGEDPSKPVSEKVHGAGIILAHLLALQCQRHWYADLWAQATKAKGEDGRVYFARLPGTLRRMFRTEVAFLYSLSRGGQEIYPQGGSHVMKDHKLTEESLLSSAVANTERCLALGKDALDRRVGDPFLEELRNVLSGPVTNLLVGPAVDEERQNCGLLVLANKKSDNFGGEDDLVALKLGKQIGPYLKSAKHGDKLVRGLEALENACGPYIQMKGVQLIKKAKEVQSAREKSERRITADDCARYLKISRPYFHKLTKTRL